MIPKLSRPILKHHEVHEEVEIDLENEEENEFDDANELTDEEELYFDNNITDDEENNNLVDEDINRHSFLPTGCHALPDIPVGGWIDALGNGKRDIKADAKCRLNFLPVEPLFIGSEETLELFVLAILQERLRFPKEGDEIMFHTAEIVARFLPKPNLLETITSRRRRYFIQCVRKILNSISPLILYDQR